MLMNSVHSHNTRFVSNGLLVVPSWNTLRYGIKSFVTSTIFSCNYFQSWFSDKNLPQIPFN